MGAIAGILIVVAFLAISFMFIIKRDDDVYETKKKIEHLFSHSKQFKSLLEKEKIDAWKAVEDPRGYFGKRLRNIIKEIEANPVAQKEINDSIELKKQFNKDIKHERELSEKELVESNIQWSVFLNDVRITEELKKAIKDLFIPLNISPYLFGENNRIINDGAFYSAIPPVYNGTLSIKKFANVPKAYPNWFAAAFPDVLVWFMDNLADSNSEISKIFSSVDAEEYIENNIFTFSGLIKLVNLYKKRVGNSFECQISK
ncbi:MAG: hypothetical protein Q8T03_07055 [Bacteroidota bacterium]|nr:hypothetical protein [Bacteroidota bacterium]